MPRKSSTKTVEALKFDRVSMFIAQLGKIVGNDAAPASSASKSQPESPSQHQMELCSFSGEESLFVLLSHPRGTLEEGEKS